MPGEKTEKATPKRRQDERKRGNVFKSQEVVTIFTMIAIFYVLKSRMPAATHTMEDMIAHFVGLAATTTTIGQEQVQAYLRTGIITFAKTAMIPLLVCCAVASVVTMFQTRGLFSPKGFAFKAERISLLKGFKRMFSMRAFVELLKSILKIVILLYVIYSILKNEIFTLPQMMDMSFDGALTRTGSIIMQIIKKAGAIFVAVAAADYLYQWKQYEKDLRMTKQEVKDEYKQTEGDPEVKGRIRQIQQERAKQRMMQAVPSADVVIRNPTHIAVAIRYNQEKDRAPVVIAKGVDSLALRIVDVAEQNGVYVTENKPLARAIYDAVPLDTEVPERFYRALAEVLAYVYSLKKKDTE
ncbi:MAG: flagellar biosynthesis protein FlhB [Oscillospiraceae bacterium]